MSAGIVVVGANLAGGRAVEALRDAGYDGRLVLVGEELARPYERPPLSKDVLRGETAEDAVYLREESWYADHDVELRLGQRATSLDPTGSLTLASGDELRFDRCLLATGGRVRRLDVPGADLEGVRYLRTLADARVLRDELASRPRVVVVGAGFIGAEVAASARRLGCEVTMLEIAAVPLGRVLGEALGRVYAAIHTDNGVRLRLGEGVERIEGSGRVASVVGTSGQRFDADLVVVGVGVVPATELAADAGLACGDGILVDDRCRTSAPDVFAAGDVANRPDAFSGERIRVEHFQNAQDQGTAAARNMLGHDHAFEQVPWFWSDQYDVNLQILGHPVGEPVMRGRVEDRVFTALYLRGAHVVAAVAMNSPKDVAVARRLIERRVRVDRARLADDDIALRELLKA